jgi:hypothetical protein
MTPCLLTDMSDNSTAHSLGFLSLIHSLSPPVNTRRAIQITVRAGHLLVFLIRAVNSVT